MGSFGSFGRSSCASKDVADTNTNTIARRRNIALHYVTQTSPTEAERRARESGPRSESRPMSIKERAEDNSAAGDKTPKQTPLVSRLRTPARSKSITATGL